MVEKQNYSAKYTLFLPFIVSILVYLLWFKVLHQRQAILFENINVLSEKLKNIEERLEKYTPNFRSFENVDFFVTEFQPEHYIDTPSFFPRLILDGILPIENSAIGSIESKGRQKGDMENVAVLIESTNQNDTERLVASIFSQRKSDKDLEIFLFTPTNKSGVSFEILKTWGTSTSGVYPINAMNWETALYDFTDKNKLYAITIIDHKHIGDDFADFYYVGKLAMEADENIYGVCGESNGIWQDRTLGDVLWLSDRNCESDSGDMMRVERDTSSKTPVIIYPEMARVGNSPKAVTEESSWNIDKFKTDLITKTAFDTRLSQDLKRAERKMQDDWSLLETFDCIDKIYTFPYETDEELKIIFKNTIIKNLHKYRGILSISISEHQCRAYIVPQHYYNKPTIDFI